MDINLAFPSNYLKAADLQGQPRVVEITYVAMEEMKGDNGNDEQKPVVYIAGQDRGVVLNKTNAMAIADLYGPETNNWTGKPIELFPAMVEAFGKTQEAIRIRKPSVMQPQTQQPAQAIAQQPVQAQPTVSQQQPQQNVSW